MKIQNGIGTLESGLVVISKKFYNVIDTFPIQPSNPTSRYLSMINEKNVIIHLRGFFYSSFIHNCPKLELTQMSIN